MRNDEGIQIEVEYGIDAVLAPGEVRPLEDLRIALGENASELLELYVHCFSSQIWWVDDNAIILFR